MQNTPHKKSSVQEVVKQESGHKIQSTTSFYDYTSNVDSILGKVSIVHFD